MRNRLTAAGVAVAAAWMAVGCGTSADPPAAGGATTVARPTEPGVYDTRTGEPVARIVVLGDSVTYGVVDDMARRFEGTDVRVEFGGLPGHGLLSEQEGGTGMFEHLLDDALLLGPVDIVVVQSLGIYPGLVVQDPWLDDDGRPLEPDSAEMWTAWEDAARRLTEQARDAGATVWWVTLPEVPGTEWADRIAATNRISRDLGVPLIDLGTLVPAGPDGGAAFDGLHFTAGAEPVVADAILDTIVWDIPD